MLKPALARLRAIQAAPGICAFSLQLVASLLDFPIGVTVLRAAELAQ
jgi:hypothetical protein